MSHAEIDTPEPTSGDAAAPAVRKRPKPGAGGRGLRVTLTLPG